MIKFERETWSVLEVALRREWLETNGLGGFASSTIVGLNSRRYHGLLVAATKPPVGRLVLLSKLEETLWIDGKRFDLSANRYPGVIYPQGFHYLKQFRLDPFPMSTYEVEGIEIEKSVFMIHGENSAVIHYEAHVAGKCSWHPPLRMALPNASPLHKRRQLSPGKANVAQKALEARVGAEGIEAWPEQDARGESFFEAFFEPTHGLILISERRIDHGNLRRIRIISA